MEKEVVKNHHHQQQQQHHHHHPHNNNTTTSTSSLREKHIIGEGFIRPPQSADFVLRWGSRKRLRCMKIQVKNDSTPVTTRTTVRVDRRVVRSDNNNKDNNNTIGSGNHPANGHFNLRQRPASPARPPSRILRNSEVGSGMKGQHSNGGGGMRGLGSPEREKKGGSHHHHNQQENLVVNGGGKTASSETKGGGSSSGGGSDVVWPPKFMIALTNKEKEEDFMAIKGSKLPQRPKKRAKFVQRTLNLVSPGGWLCDLTLERYEVREKKITKKRPRGLKAMGNYMESDSD